MTRPATNALPPAQREDTARSHLRNALQIVELILAENRGAAAFGFGMLVCERRSLNHVTERICAAIHQLDTEAGPTKLSDDEFRAACMRDPRAMATMFVSLMGLDAAGYFAAALTIETARNPVDGAQLTFDAEGR